MTFKTYLNEYTKRKISDLIANRAIPLSSPMMDRLGYSFQTKAWHLTNHRHLEELVKNQNSKKQLSTFTKGGKELVRLPSQPDVLVELEGIAVLEGKKDLWTIVDTQGRRWIDHRARVKGNKLTFFIDGILTKLLGVDVNGKKPGEVLDIIENLSNKEKSIFYKDYINAIERYIDGGGYKDLADYIEKSAPMDYNEVVLNQYKILNVKVIDFESPNVLATISKLGLNYDGIILSKDLAKLK
jgi:hypothetical protein